MKEETLRMFVCLFFDVFLEKITQFFSSGFKLRNGVDVSVRASLRTVQMASVEATIDQLKCCNPSTNT